MRVLITGGSHIGALYRALKAGTVDVPAPLEISIRPLGGGVTVAGEFFQATPSAIVVTEERFQKHIRRIPPTDFECEKVGFCTALYSRPVWMGRDWARYAPHGVLNGRKTVSRGMLTRLVLDDLRHVLKFLDAARTLGIEPFVVDCPRPFEHNPEVSRAGRKVILAIDAHYRAVATQELQRRAIPIVAAPARTYDSEGFSLPEFAHDKEGDKTHANAAFGALMMQQVVNFLSAAPEARTA